MYLPPCYLASVIDKPGCAKEPLGFNHHGINAEISTSARHSKHGFTLILTSGHASITYDEL